MSNWNPSHRRHGSSSASNRVSPDFTANLCLKLVDFGIGSLIFAGPHLFGGRHMLGRFVILSLCVVTALAWFSRQVLAQKPCWHRGGALGLCLAAIACVAFQLVPLPDNLLNTLSPRIANILPTWTNTTSANVHLGKWQTLSLAPEETRLALATLVAYVLLFVTTVQRLESREDVKKIIRWIGYSAIIVAALGIVQYFTANGKFFWFYEYPYTDTIGELKACFTSRNHFAHFLVLGLTCLLSWIMLRRGKSQSIQGSRNSLDHFSKQHASDSHPSPVRMGLYLGITVVVIAILASLSRGGALAMASAIVVVVAIYSYFGLVRSKHIACGALLTVVAMAALSVSGEYEKVTERLESLTSQSLDKLDSSRGRRRVWSANLEAIRAGHLTGSGAGTHRFIYPLYMKEAIPSEYTHAENGYLQIATENGLLGVVLLILALGTCGFWCWRAMRHAGNDQEQLILTGGIAAALAASAVHAIVDFVWFIPACAVVTILLAACASRLAQFSSQSFRHLTPPVTLGIITRFNMCVAAALVGTWTVFTLFPSARTSLEWDRYLLADNAHQATAERRAHTPGEAQTDLVEAEELNASSVLIHLARVVHDYPHSARAHIRLAGGLLSRFESLQQKNDNPMAINQIREAAQASQFNSPQALRQWLETAFGKNCRLLYQAHFHACRALELCPLQGEGYLYLAELCFLEGRNSLSTEDHYSQSLLVRPYDPEVLFSVGKYRLIAGKVEEAFRLWRIAFQGSGKHQRHIMQILAGRMSADNFVQLFSPDWTSLEYLWHSYQQSGTREDLKHLLPYAQQVAERQSPKLNFASAAATWLSLSQMQKQMNDPRAALHSLHVACSANPENFAVRYQLGQSLLDFKQYEQAEPHWRWCLSQQPDNPTFQDKLMQAFRGKMQRLARFTHSNSL